METETMGRVVVETTITNLEDTWAAKNGLISDRDVRIVTVPDALVDTGASGLAMPVSLMQKLGLAKRYEKRVRTLSGTAMVSVYEPVRMVIADRHCVIDPFEAPEGTPVLVGQIPLEIMDFVVDPKRQRLIGNPEHGGEWMWDAF